MATLTIKDIARLAGVSTAAVSFVINDKPGVSDATREHIKAVMQQNGFTPNVHTRRLNLGKSFTIQVVMRRYHNNLFSQFTQETLQGIFNASHTLGYSISFTFLEEQGDYGQLLSSVRSKDCDGMILYQISDASFIADLQQEQIPFVCVDSHLPLDGKLPLVEVDYRSAARTATQYLIKNGHKNIGFIGSDASMAYYFNTFGGYREALTEGELKYHPEWLAKLPYDETLTVRELGQLLKCKALPTAFFCAGDAFAIPVIKFFKQNGLRIPEDISVMSVDDLMISRYLDPPLSTMTFDKERMGTLAMELLYKILQGEDYENVNLLPMKVVERNTVKKI